MFACTAATTNIGLPIRDPTQTTATTATTISNSPQELAGWKERIASIASRAQATYVITNNHYESKAGVNALELKAMISGKREVVSL